MPEISPTANADELRRAISELWERRRDEILETIDSAIALTEPGDINDDADMATIESELRTISHQLIGIIGVFGIDSARTLVSRIDIEAHMPLDRSRMDDVGALLRQLRRSLEKTSDTSTNSENHRPR
jgi:hypothetical protein